MTAALALAVIFTGPAAATVMGQNSGGVELLADRLQSHLDQFERSVGAALDRSTLNNSDVEDQMNALVDELEYEAHRLDDRADDGVPIARDVVNVLGSACLTDLPQRYGISGLHKNSNAEAFAKFQPRSF